MTADHRFRRSFGLPRESGVFFFLLTVRPDHFIMKVKDSISLFIEMAAGMSSLTDMIERTILDLIDKQDGFCELSRNAFASELQVAPSQITYVITTRFSHRHGYMVESRRGGSGFVRITRVPYTEETEYLLHLARSVPDRLSQHQAIVMINQLMALDLLSRDILLLMKTALSDTSLRQIAVPTRDRVRSDLLRQMLTRLAAGEG